MMKELMQNPLFSISAVLLVLLLWLWALRIMGAHRIFWPILRACMRIVWEEVTKPSVSRGRQFQLLFAGFLLLQTEEMFGGIVDALIHNTEFNPLLLASDLPSTALRIVATALVFLGIQRAYAESKTSRKDQCAILMLSWQEKRFGELAEFLQIHDCSALLDSNLPEWKTAPKCTPTDDEVKRCVALLTVLSAELNSSSTQHR